MLSSPSGKAPLFRKVPKYDLRLRRHMPMFQISRKTPAYYFTAVAHNRLPIFRTDRLKLVVCNAFKEARENHGVLVLAYVIMPDHTHLLVYLERKMEDVLRLLNGISARRVIQYLNDYNFGSSLLKLRGMTRERNHKHSVWQHHPDSLEIFGEDTFRQKVDYIHMNPVRAGLVEHPNDYGFSSARVWSGMAISDEPLLTDHTEIDWR
jgi:putative transposase